MQDLTPYLSPALPTADDIKDVIAAERPAVAYSHYARILDASMTPVILANPPNPADPSDVTPWILSANLTRNISQDVVTQADLKISSDLADAVNMLIVYLQLFYIAWDMTDPNNPVELLKVPRCIVGFEIPDRSISDGYIEIDITSFEPIWRIRDLYFQNPFVPPAGMKVTDVIGALLQMDNIPPDEGGRAPSGLPGTGAPQQFPGTAYCSVGVAASTVCTATNADGSLEDPNGLFSYNPDAHILVDATTHVPIDPWTCNPMSVVYTEANTCQTSTGLYFNTLTGAFYAGGYPAGFDPTTGHPNAPVDPFTLQPLPPGREYYIPDAASPSNTLGNTPGPLLTWPYDYTGAGPYYGTGGTGQTTSGGGTTPSTGSGPTSIPIGAAASLAQRDGTGTIVLIDAGEYSVQPMLCSNDPALTGHSWCQPRGGVYESLSASVDGYSWPAGTWDLTVNLRGGPVPAGTVAVFASLYLEDAAGGFTLLGTTAEGTPVSFAAGASTLAVTCSVAVAAIVAPPGAVIVAEITLDLQTNITCTLGASVATASIAVSSMTLGFPAPTVTTTTTTPPTTTGGNRPTTVNQGGTNVVWPDSNNPGMCPSGCATPGPNIPQARLNIVPSTIPIGVPTAYDRTQNLLATLIALCKSINYNPPWSDETAAVVQIGPKPLFSESIPTAVWSFRTDVRRAIKPPFSQKLADQTGLGNKVIFMSAPTSLPPITVMATNRATDSEISIPNLGREVMLPPIQDDNVTDTATANLIARTALQAAASAMEAIQFTTASVPFLQPYDPIDVTILSIDGEVVVDGGTFPYFISQITEDLFDPTSMQITAGRAVAV